MQPSLHTYESIHASMYIQMYVFIAYNMINLCIEWVVLAILGRIGGGAGVAATLRIHMPKILLNIDLNCLLFMYINISE